MPHTLASAFIYWRYIPKSGLAGSYGNFVCFEEVTVFPCLSFNRIFCFPLLKIEKNEAEGWESR